MLRFVIIICLPVIRGLSFTHLFFLRDSELAGHDNTTDRSSYLLASNRIYLVTKTIEFFTSSCRYRGDSNLDCKTA